MERIVNVKVKPASGGQAIEEKDGVLIVSLKSKPEEGKANLELVKLLSKHFGANVKILRGLKSKRKLVTVSD